MFGFNFLNKNTHTKKLINGFESTIDFNKLKTKLTRGDSLVGSRDNMIVGNLDGKEIPLFSLEIVGTPSIRIDGGRRLETTILKTTFVDELKLKNIGTIVRYNGHTSVIVGDKSLFGQYDIVIYSSGKLIPLKVHGGHLNHVIENDENLPKLTTSLIHLIGNMKVHDIDTFYIRGKLHTYIITTKVVNVIDY